MWLLPRAPVPTGACVLRGLLSRGRRVERTTDAVIGKGQPVFTTGPSAVSLLAHECLEMWPQSSVHLLRGKLV